MLGKPCSKNMLNELLACRTSTIKTNLFIKRVPEETGGEHTNSVVCPKLKSSDQQNAASPCDFLGKDRGMRIWWKILWRKQSAQPFQRVKWRLCIHLNRLFKEAWKTTSCPFSIKLYILIFVLAQSLVCGENDTASWKPDKTTSIIHHVQKHKLLLLGSTWQRTSCVWRITTSLCLVLFVKHALSLSCMS